MSGLRFDHRSLLNYSLTDELLELSKDTMLHYVLVFI